MSTDDTNAARRGSESNDLLGPAVPDSVLAYLHAYGDSRADDDGHSGLRIAEAISALRRWAAELQDKERKKCIAAVREEPGDSGMDGLQPYFLEPTKEDCLRALMYLPPINVQIEASHERT